MYNTQTPLLIPSEASFTAYMYPEASPKPTDLVALALASRVLVLGVCETRGEGMGVWYRVG